MVVRGRVVARRPDDRRDLAAGRVVGFVADRMSGDARA
jgi:hypothetical protein